MATKLFDLTDLNVAGICHGISCKWVRESIRRGVAGVASDADLGSPMALFMMYELPRSMDDIITNYHLRIDNHEQFDLRNKTLDNFMERTLRGTGYKLLGLGSYRLKGAEHQREGHTMAMRKITNSVQFFDPNFGAWSFTNSVELRDWLPTYLRTEYRDLIGSSSDIWAVSNAS